MAKLTATLTDLLRKGVEYTWGKKEQATFSALKDFLCSPPMLHITDPHRSFELITDASNIAVGAILLQDFRNGLQPIAYESRKLHPPERSYLIHDCDMLAIVHAFKPKRAWQQVTVDFVTGLRASPSGNDAVMVVVYHFTSYKKSISAEETARLFIAVDVRLYGIPLAIISDRDTKFTSNFWKSLYE
ncbi:unnamed protein product [Closterium sp. NIES-54]